MYVQQVRTASAVQPGPVKKNDSAEETDEEFVDDGGLHVDCAVSQQSSPS